jgi:hypothetical protein
MLNTTVNDSIDRKTALLYSVSTIISMQRFSPVYLVIIEKIGRPE